MTKQVVLGLLIWSIAVALPTGASAVPAGREWGEIQILPVPGFDAFVVPRLEMTSSGTPLLFGTAIINQTNGLDDGLGYRWDGASWQPWWRLGSSPLALWPVDAAPGRYPLIYTGGSFATNHTFFVSEVVDDHVSPPEIIANVGEYRIEYAGAFRDRRRWTAIEDRGTLRLFFSDEPNLWQEVTTGAIGNYGLSLVALDDTTALMAWTGDGEPLDWGVLRGHRWEHADQSLFSGFGLRPRLRTTHDGGAWLTWSSQERSVYVRRFDGHAWAAPETLFCPSITTTQGAEALATDLSRDSAYRPLVAWSYTNYLDGSAGVVASFPNDHGWEPGDQFYSSGYGAVPTIGRDRNGDAWIAWSESFQPFRYTHTHTSATTNAPSIEVDQGHPKLTWTLSNAAPETWWAVIRKKGSGNFESVARLQAGASLSMSWTDPEIQLGWVQRDDITYRIRRESVDLRYEWLSPIARFTNGPKRKMHLGTPGFSDGTLTIDLSDVFEPEVAIIIYSLAGRVVDQRTLQTGTASSTHQLQLASGLRAGVYFVRARVPSGAVSEASKFVLVR
jgi:hypothetical protein